MRILQPNLLPPSAQQELRLILLSRAVLRLGGLAAAGILVFSVLLVPSFLLLSFQREEFNRQAGLQENASGTKASNATNSAIDSANKSIVAVKTALAKTRAVSTALGEIIAVFPSGVRLAGFTFERSNGTLQLSGVADTRDTLLALTSRLSSLPLIAKVDLPTSSLVKQRDVNFSVRLTLKP